MGFILNFLLWVVVEGALWGIGAAARKAVGKPLTKNGICRRMDRRGYSPGGGDCSGRNLKIIKQCRFRSLTSFCAATRP